MVSTNPYVTPNLMNNISRAKPDASNTLNIGLIKISGIDSISFLQGQLSNDMNELQSGSEKKWHYSGYCNQKGRLIALLKVWREGDDVFVLMNHDLIDNTVDRLRKYVMRSKVVIEVIETARCSGYASIENLKTVLEKSDSNFIEKLNDEPNAVCRVGKLSVLTIANRYLLVDKANSIDSNGSNKMMSSADWFAEDINDGLPDVSIDSSELFIPQMLNLDLLGGINFKKGCYTGQEIVARMHYLGKLKQRMFVCEFIQGDAITLQSGSNIYSDAELSKSAGTIVSSDSGSKKLLAVLRLTELDNTHYVNDTTIIKVAAEQAYKIPLTVDK